MKSRFKNEMKTGTIIYISFISKYLEVEHKRNSSVFGRFLFLKMRYECMSTCSSYMFICLE